MTPPDKLTKFRRETARRLRANETSAEARLWREIDRVPLLRTHFRRQAPIGPYVVDFVCLKAKLVIEIDGASHTVDGAEARDARRTVWLEQEGYRVLRFWNAEAFDNIDGVLDTIYAALYGALDAEPAPFTPRQTAARPPVTPPRATLLRDPPPRGEGGNSAPSKKMRNRK